MTFSDIRFTFISGNLIGFSWLPQSDRVEYIDNSLTHLSTHYIGQTQRLRAIFFFVCIPPIQKLSKTIAPLCHPNQSFQAQTRFPALCVGYTYPLWVSDWFKVWIVSVMCDWPDWYIAVGFGFFEWLNWKRLKKAFYLTFYALKWDSFKWDSM